MNGEQRTTIVDTAKYLRNVRPIDPEEVVEYVEGHPHPAVVRRTLREEAFDLGIVEREDGTFVPALEEPFDPDFDGVDAVPDPYGRRLDDLLVDRYGPDWEHGESGDALRETIRELKDRYVRQHPVEYDEEAALGYAIYHLPDYYATVQYVLDELGSDGLVPAKLRVLDVGAGVGGPALGLADYLSDALVEYHAVEPSAAADVLAAVLDETGRNFHHHVHRTTAESFDPEGEYDLVLFANVLIELDDPVETVRRFAKYLVADGALVAIAPADKNTSIALRDVERKVVDGAATAANSERASGHANADRYTVYSPTLRLWPGEAPTDRGWSFNVGPDIEVPELQRRLDEGRRETDDDRDPATGEFVNTSVQYSHVIVRRDGVRRLEVTPDPSRFAKMAAMDGHVTDRVDCLAVKLSHSLSSEGGRPIFKVGDGSESVGHYAVLTRETALNRTLSAADYGDVLVFESVLVLWNDDEGAYNLVVDEETVVDRMPAGE